MFKLGRHYRQFRPYTAAEDALILTNFHPGETRALARDFGRTIAAIATRRYFLRKNLDRTPVRPPAPERPREAPAPKFSLSRPTWFEEDYKAMLTGGTP